MVTAINVEVFPGVLQTEEMYIGEWREAIEAEMNIRQSETVGSAICGGIDVGSDVQKPIPSTFRSGGCEEYEDDRGSSLLTAELCEISENVRKILRVAM